MDSSLNGHTARERLLRTELPKRKEDWPHFKEIRDAAVEEQAVDDAGQVEARRLKAIDGLARDLRYLAALKPEGYSKRISEVIEQLKGLCK